MNTVPIGALQVESDLRFEVDGLPARLVADGTQLTVSTRDAGVFLARILNTVPAATLPSGEVVRGGLALVATTLDAAGLSARLVDDRGTVLEVGHGCHSALGRVLFGTGRARLGPVSIRAAGAVLRDSQVVRRRLGVAAGGVAVAALMLGAGLRRRSMLRGAR